MPISKWFFTLAALTALMILALPLSAQKMTEHEVGVSQLMSSPTPKSQPAPTESQPAPTTTNSRPTRTSAEVEEIFKSMVDGFRSACCPFQEMRNELCPCHEQQTAMLRFLIMQGFTQNEVRKYMINGGPKELRDDYITYLRSLGYVSVNEFLARSFTLKSGLTGPGWDKGWTSLIEETPRDTNSWTLVVILGLFVLVAFVVGYKVLKRGQATDPSKDEELRAIEVSDEMRVQIEREARALDDE